MLKWLKSSPAGGASAEAPKMRPPWIQKIRVDMPPVNTTGNGDGAWQSRLGEKLKALRQAETEMRPTHVAGQSEETDFAFQLTPLDMEAPAAPRGVAAERPGVEQKPYAPVAEQVNSPPVEYITQPAPRILAATGVYELTHSTADYGGGDEFDIDNLFDDHGRPAPGAATPGSWSAPEETIEALAKENIPTTRDFVSRVETNDTFDDIELEPVPAKNETGSKPAQPQVSSRKAVEKVAEKPLEKVPAATSGDRASVTPVLTVNKQRELLFPLLRTQKRALEFTNPAEAQSVIEKLEETLEQFSIEGHVVGIQRGPIVTRYELKMAAGIKVNRILALTDELAMALEAMRVRIEAPIPGRSTVGIEIPNKQRAKVLLGDVLNDAGYKEFGGQLPLPLGRDIAGNLLIEDLTRMPHLLIAGATGSGKSVAVNSFISSLIMNKTPEEVRFLLVDPKLVELSAYNDIPHLLHPVITEPNKAILALNWAVEEMERRYEDLAEMRTRDIRSFNEKVRANHGKSEYPIMPYIVVLIDELGDLMMVAGKEVESSIIRLAQKARAVGIHLILATQRPSVDVITALIKANCPARIALQVAQKTDSRTILDSNGAEQLLGQGDMLFRHPSKGVLIRAQVPLIEDNEVEDVVTYAKKLAKPVYITLEDPKGKMGELEDGDEELFDEAWQIIVESQKASASYLQRRLRIGYNKAARLIEAFEARAMIGPQIGSKPREIIGGTGQGTLHAR
jgi:DNA segregation ATPase FtsK/SpoIIIE, S-DNA-T family